MPEQDWKLGDKESSGVSHSEAYGIDPDGIVVNLNVSAVGKLFAHVGSSDAQNGTPSNYEASAAGTSHPTDFDHLVSAKTRLGCMGVSHTTGYVGGAKAASGAKMIHHYEARKSGRATGVLKLEASFEGSADELPEDTIAVIAGNSFISAVYSRSADQWWVSGSLRTATGVVQINEPVDGFDNLDKQYNFDEAVTQGDDFSIIAKVNDGSVGDQLKVTSAGSRTDGDAEQHGYVILDAVIGPDH